MNKQKFTIAHQYWQLLWSILLVLIIWNMPQCALAEANQQDINGIIQAREIALKAINTRDFSKIEPYLHPSFTITTVDNQVFHQVQEFEKYWNQQFSSSIQKIAMEVKVDDPRRFLSSETEVSYGDAIATFSFQDGNSANMAMRWTAVMQKFQGRWTIQSLHFSSNLLNNPLLYGAQKAGRAIAVATGLGGVIVGAVGMLFWHRSRKQVTSRL